MLIIDNNMLPLASVSSKLDVTYHHHYPRLLHESSKLNSNCMSVSEEYPAVPQIFELNPISNDSQLWNISLGDHNPTATIPRTKSDIFLRNIIKNIAIHAANLPLSKPKWHYLCAPHITSSLQTRNSLVAILDNETVLSHYKHVVPVKSIDAQKTHIDFLAHDDYKATPVTFKKEHNVMEYISYLKMNSVHKQHAASFPYLLTNHTCGSCLLEEHIYCCTLLDMPQMSKLEPQTLRKGQCDKLLKNEIYCGKLLVDNLKESVREIDILDAMSVSLERIELSQQKFANVVDNEFIIGTDFATPPSVTIRSNKLLSLIQLPPKSTITEFSINNQPPGVMNLQSNMCGSRICRMPYSYSEDVSKGTGLLKILSSSLGRMHRHLAVLSSTPVCLANLLCTMTDKVSPTVPPYIGYCKVMDRIYLEPTDEIGENKEQPTPPAQAHLLGRNPQSPVPLAAGSIPHAEMATHGAKPIVPSIQFPNTPTPSLPNVTSHPGGIIREEDDLSEPTTPPDNILDATLSKVDITAEPQNTIELASPKPTAHAKSPPEVFPLASNTKVELVSSISLAKTFLQIQQHNFLQCQNKDSRQHFKDSMESDFKSKIPKCTHNPALAIEEQNLTSLFHSRRIINSLRPWMNFDPPKPLILLINPNLLDSYPKLTCQLQDEYNISCIDCNPIAPPIDIIIDEITGCCIFHISDGEQDLKTVFKNILKSITYEMQKYKTLWIVVVTEDMKSIDSDTCMLFYQAVARFPADVCVRFAKPMFLANLICSVCESSWLHMSSKYRIDEEYYVNRNYLQKFAVSNNNSGGFMAHCEFLQFCPMINLYQAAKICSSYNLKHLVQLTTTNIKCPKELLDIFLVKEWGNEFQDLLQVKIE